jgi:tetratricopeptide (TPR) repeat protein
MRDPWVLLVVAVLLAGFGGGVAAKTHHHTHHHAGDRAHGHASDDKWRRCANNDDPEVSIGGCTEVIESGRERPKDLAQAYKFRGDAYVDKEELGKAIADFDRSISLNPHDADAYAERGYALRNFGQQARAEADFDKARDLDPDIEIEGYE